MRSYGSTDRQFMMRYVAAFLFLSNTHTHKQTERERGSMFNIHSICTSDFKLSKGDAEVSAIIKLIYIYMYILNVCLVF